MKSKYIFISFKKLILIMSVLCTSMILAQYSQACSVPVFRYALERWKPDAYKGIYIYRGKISEQDQALLDQLVNASSSDSPLNLIIKPVNADTFSKEKLNELLKGPVPERLPCLSIWYPNQMGKNPPFIQESLTPSFVNNLIQSPKRQALAESLINGESVVWVFIHSGNKKKDEDALNLITQELGSALKKYSKNPFSILEGAKRVKLTYGFPVMTLKRDDPAERILIETLMKSESDLYEHTDEPMVFPVFGRGRSLGCLFGEFITKKNIDEATFFLSGACSCEVKNLNPGVDLLVAAPWDYVVMNSFIQDEPVPELTGVMPDAEQDDSLKETEPLPEEMDPDGNSSLLKIYGVALLGVIFVVVVAGFMISRGRREK